MTFPRFPRLLLGLLLLPGCPSQAPSTTSPMKQEFNSAPGAPTGQAAPFPQAAPTALPNSSDSSGTTPQLPDQSQKPAQTTSTLYLSYDDSASTAAVELTKFRLNNNQLPDAGWARPWEFFNYETFATTGAVSQGRFQVSMGLWNHGNDKGQYDLGVHVLAPTLDKTSRKNLVLTAIVDVSGSMNDAVPATQDYQTPLSLLETAKVGLKALVTQLKPGDVVNLVKFSDGSSTLLDNFIYDGANTTPLLDAINSLATEGSTNLNAGIDEGYRLAQSRYDASKVNRVVLLTDAYANVGEVDPQKISGKTRINNQEGIYFSGLGFGSSFNEAFLNQLTEAGKGSYFSVVTPQDAKRAFSDRLMALLYVAARNVQFKLDFPASLTHASTASEEHSSDPSAVQTTNFAFNTAQYFLEGFKAANGDAKNSDQLTLTIAFQDPDTGASQTEVYTQSIGDLMGQNVTAIQEASLIKLLTDRMAGKVTDQEAQSQMDGELSGVQSSLASSYRGLVSKLLNLTP